MKQNQADRAFLLVSLIGFGLMSVSFLLMPIEAIGILPGLLFWGGLLLGTIFQIVLEARRRAFFAKYQVQRKRMQKPRNGLLTFASNKFAKIADCVFLASIVATVLAFVLTRGSGYACFVGISCLLFSFCCHCVLNGRNYFHVNNQTRIRQVLEQKKANSLEKGEGKDDQ